MESSNRSRSLRAWVAVVGASSLMLLPATGAQAASEGPYSGFAHGSVVHVDAVNAADTRLADLEVGVSNAAVDSEGLERTLNEYSREIIPGSVEGKKSYGHSSIAELGLAHAPDAENQVVPFEASSASPGGADVDDAVISQTIDPLVHADVLRNVARSRWNASTCVIGEPISIGEQHFARAQLLEQDGKESTERFDGPLVGVFSDDAGPDRSATSVKSLEQLFVGDGDGLGLQSVTAATIAPVTLFEGTANEFTIEISGPAFLSAVADGTNGGAAVEFRVPLVTILQGGEITQVLPGQEINVEVPGGGDNIASIKVGVLESEQTSSNGRTASAVGNVVEVKLLDITSQDFRGATVAIGHLEAESNVPADGIACPIPVTKDANPDSVSVDDLFTVTIEVDNPFDCPLTNVRLIDDITTRTDAEFEIVRTRPSADSATSGAGLTSGEIRWSLGTIAPGESKSVEATFQALGGAGRIIDTATAIGSLGNCNAGLGEATEDITALAKVKVPVSGDVTLSIPESAVLGADLAPTGVPVALASGLSLLGAGGLGATLMRIRTRRRRMNI